VVAILRFPLDPKYGTLDGSGLKVTVKRGQNSHDIPLG
jgi:hypothetical protein